MNFVLEETKDGIDLVVTGEWSRDAIRALADGRATGLVLNYARGFRERDLEFLIGLSVQRLHVLARTITDLSPIYSLGETLLSLRVQSDTSARIDLTRFPRLRVVSADWEQIQGTVDQAPQLEELFVGHFSERNLSCLSGMSSLTSIIMKDYPRVESFDGAEGLESLETLEVHLARSLSDISALARLPSRRLSRLKLPSCRKISAIDAVSNCTKLKFFELSESGEIESVAPLAELTDVESLYLYGSTQVRDRDLRPIAALPRLTDFRMQPRRGYSPSVQTIESEILRRTSWRHKYDGVQ